MKRILKSTLSLLLVVVILLSATVTAFGAEGRWIKSGSRWWYRHSDNTYTVNGWEKINGCWYRFDKLGWMQTGWVKDGGSWYYLRSDGTMKTSYLYDKNGDTYYLKSNGKMATGWWKINQEWHYFYPSGKMARAAEINGYYVDNYGVWIEKPGLTLDGNIVKVYVSYSNHTEDSLYERKRFSCLKYSADETVIETVASYLAAVQRSEAVLALSEEINFTNGYTMDISYADGSDELCYIFPDGRLYCDGFVYQTDIPTVRAVYLSL